MRALNSIHSPGVEDRFGLITSFTRPSRVGEDQLVSTPGEADMVLDIRLEGAPFPSAQFRLVYADPKTHVSLWTINELFIGYGTKKSRDKKFDDAMNSLVADLNMACPACSEAN